MGQLVFIAAGGGGGSVNGTGTDNHLVRWDGTGVPLIQDSGWVLDDLGNMVVPWDIEMAQEPGHDRASRNDPGSFILRGSDGIDDVTVGPTSIAGGLHFIGGAGADNSAGPAQSGGEIFLFGGPAGLSSDGSIKQGGPIILESGENPAFTLGSSFAGLNLTSASFDDVPRVVLIALTTTSDPNHLIQGGELDLGKDGGYITFHSELVGGGTRLASGFAAASDATGVTGIRGGYMQIVAGPTVSPDTNLVLTQGASTRIGAAFTVDLTIPGPVGSLSGDIELALNGQPSSGGSLGVYADGGILFSGADGIAYWRTHDVSAGLVGDLRGSQRVHLVDAATEGLMELNSFSTAVPPVGFFHYSLEDFVGEPPFPAPDGDNSYQYGFRGFRNNVTRTMARIYTKKFTDADIVNGTLTVDHQLGTDCPIVQIWKDTSGTGDGGWGIAQQGTDYLAVLTPSFNDANFGNQIGVLFSAPISGVWRVTISGY